MTSPHDNFRRALERLLASFEAVQLAPSIEAIERFEQSSKELRLLHAPVLERAWERARAVDEARGGR